jgi:penicillin-binding protein 1A
VVQRGLFRVGALALFAGVLAGCGPVLELGADEPLAFIDQPRTSQILSPQGDVLAALHGIEDRTDVVLEDVSQQLVAAVIATEDRRFFLHNGVDLPAIGRAAARNVEAGEVAQGGSTLTQQLVKTTMTGPARTLDRKIEEALLAIRLERTHDKDEILERYLNTVYFGRGAYGVGAASERFFGTTADALTTEQAALLAGVIASPSGFDPWDEPEAARTRRALVLDAMVDTGQLDAADARRLRAEPLVVADLAGDTDDALAPWIVAEVRRQLQRDPDERFAALGEDVEQRVDALFSGGLRITTTIDLATQARAEAEVAERFDTPQGPTAAVVALDPSSGAIRALVGGRARDAAVGFNVATQGRRSPGSAFKPLMLAAALEQGIGLDTEYPGGTCAVFEDVPGWDDEGACNYGQTDYGPLTLREATVRSANTVYARLAVELEPRTMLTQARQFGIGGPLNEVHALALGSEAVTPLDLAAAYGAFATLGHRADPYLIERIETADGQVLYDHEPTSLRVIADATAWAVTDTLRDVVERGTGVNASIDRPQAGKTGTSQDNADAWFVGYTPDLVTAVWVGVPEGSVPLRPPLTDEVIEGGRAPAEIWAAVTTAALEGRPALDFAEPERTLVEVEVDVSRNCLPNPYTPQDVIETRPYLVGTEPTARCTEPAGPTLDDVPTLIGLPIDVATRLLRERGFELEVRPAHSRVFPPGISVDQHPAPGADLDIGEVVTVWRSVVSRTRLEPADVLGLDRDEARATLEAAGFVVRIEEACPCSQPPGTVHGQQPAPGVPTLEHDLVTLTVVPDEPVVTDDTD